jgi:outer membrane protein
MNMKWMLLMLLASITLAACGGKKKNQEEDTKIETPVFRDGIKIGYYNQDTLNEQYKLIEAINKEMEGQLRQMNSGFEAKVKNFENWARGYEDKIKNNLLISSEVQKFQEQFQQRQMELAQEEQNLQMQMQQIQNDNLMKAFNRIEDFTKRYAKENGYDLILQYAKGGQVMFISPELDITGDILKGLNAEFEELNGSDEKEKK